MIKNILYITILCVWLVESGAIESVKDFLSRLTGRRWLYLRPFDCAKCLAFWTTAIYVAFWEDARLDGFALCVGASIIADIAGRVINFIIFTVKRLIDKIQDKI